MAWCRFLCLGFSAWLICVPAQAADDWITEEVLKQLTEVRQALKTLTQEVSMLKQKVQVLSAMPRQNSPPVQLGTLPMLGAATATVAIIEFADFECPFCIRHVKHVLPRLRKTYIDTGKVLYIKRDFPLSFHPAARTAAAAVRCAAAQQQEAYWALHQQLFGTGITGLTATDYVQMATTLGLSNSRLAIVCRLQQPQQQWNKILLMDDN